MSDIFSILKHAATLITIILVGLFLHTLTASSVALVSVLAGVFFLVVLVISLIFMNRNQYNFFPVIAALLATLIVGRLFSTMRFADAGSPDLSSLDPLLIAETGPGIWSMTLATTILAILLTAIALKVVWHRRGTNPLSSHYTNVSSAEWGMTFLRVYVGLMFIAHFTGHLFGGPIPFTVFADYFGSIGLPYPAAFVILAGLIELAVTIGLAFGFMTRIAAFGAVVYLFVSVGLGGHYSVGYVWVLPTGGWEFPALWMFAVSLFITTGGGPVSVDAWLREKSTSLPTWIRTAIS